MALIRSCCPFILMYIPQERAAGRGILVCLKLRSIYEARCGAHSRANLTKKPGPIRNSVQYAHTPQVTCLNLQIICNMAEIKSFLSALNMQHVSRLQFVRNIKQRFSPQVRLCLQSTVITAHQRWKKLVFAQSLPYRVHVLLGFGNCTGADSRGTAQHAA